LTKVDKRVIRAVGLVFEVIAQVDRRLSKVNAVNAAENLGRHSLPPLNRISSRDSTTRLEQHFLTEQGLQRWKICSLIFLYNRCIFQPPKAGEATNPITIKHKVILMPTHSILDRVPSCIVVIN
jgi:hypothetical protein